MQVEAYLMLTAREILQTDFRQSLRGYSTKEVDAWVSRVVKAYETIAHQNRELSDQVAALEDALREDERAAQKRNDLMQQARDTADKLRADAEYQANALLRQSEQRATEIVNNARVREREVAERVSQLQSTERDIQRNLRNLLDAAATALKVAEARAGEIGTQPARQEVASAEDL